jgi:hypothetical protein
VVDAATEAVIQQGGTIHEEGRSDAAGAAIDGQPKDFLAKVIGGNTEGPYKPKGGWTLTVGRH